MRPGGLLQAGFHNRSSFRAAASSRAAGVGPITVDPSGQTLGPLALPLRRLGGLGGLALTRLARVGEPLELLARRREFAGQTLGALALLLRRLGGLGGLARALA